MNKDLKIFTNEQFGDIRTLQIEGEIWFIAKDIAEILELGNLSQALLRLDDDEKNTIILNEGIGNPNKIIINESGLYNLVLSSRKPEAKQFKKWITAEVLPAIRKTGGYISNTDLLVNTYFGSLEESEKAIIKGLIVNIEQQQRQLQLKDKVIEEKEDIIINLVDTVSLEGKRKIINRIIRQNHRNYQERWNELYQHFEMKYRINLDARIAKYNASNKTKVRNKLDYIDRVMGKIPELFEIACKIYENDVKRLADELYKIV